MSNQHEIILQEAIELATRYRSNRPDGFALSETFEVAAINKLTATRGCKFLRIYYGMKEDMRIVLILVAANEDREDILPDNNTITTAEPVIIEEGIICPPICPPTSPLNS